MKKFGKILVLFLTISALGATAALADCGKCPTKSACPEAAKLKAAVNVPGYQMEACCIEAAKAGKGCHGKDAATLQAAFAEYSVAQIALADMGECCVEALGAGKGCCGHSPEELKAEFEKKVTEAKKAEAAGRAQGAAKPAPSADAAKSAMKEKARK